MALKRYYQICVALPLLIPVLVWPLTPLVGSDTTAISCVGGTAYILIGAAGFGGIPYVLLALPLLWAFRDKPAEVYRRFSLVAPLVFAPFLVLCGLALFRLAGNDLGLGILLYAGAYGLLAIVVGYFYVGLAHLLRLALSRYGLLGSARAA